MDAVEDTAVLMRLAYHPSKALAKCEGLQAGFGHFLRCKDLAALSGQATKPLG